MKPTTTSRTPNDLPPNKKRLARACERCRSRKVRCDASLSPADCTNCRLDDAECIIIHQRRVKTTWKDGLKRRRPNGSAALDRNNAEGTSASNQSMSDTNQPDVQANDNTKSAPAHGSTLHHTFPRASTTFGNPTIDSLIPLLRSIDLATLIETHRAVESDPLNHHLSILPGLGNQSSSRIILPPYIAPLPPTIVGEDIEYLYSKGALSVPQVSFRNRLLQSFVEYVYPFLPLINLQELLSIVQQGDGRNGQISLLVFQAIMLAGSAFIETKHIIAAGFQSRSNVCQIFLRKVKLLYEFDVEQSYTHLIQALLLMTHGFEESNEQKDMWYWMSIVVTLSHTCGLHHCPEMDDNSDSENRLNRRLWWCVYMRNQHVAFGMRRRARIRHKDRIPMLTISDFECDTMPNEIIAIWDNCILLRDPVQRRQLAGLCIEMCKLTVCIAEIMSSQFRTRNLATSGNSSTKTILVPKDMFNINPHIQKLDGWVQNVPPVYQYNSASSISGFESPIMVVHKAILRMLYLSIVGSLQTPHVLPVSPTVGSICMALGAAKYMGESCKEIVQGISLEILHIAMDMHSLGLVDLLPSTGIIAIMTTTIIQLADIQSSPGTELTESHQQYSQSISILRELCGRFPFAEPGLTFLGTLSSSNIANVSTVRGNTITSDSTACDCQIVPRSIMEQFPPISNLDIPNMSHHLAESNALNSALGGSETYTMMPHTGLSDGLWGFDVGTAECEEEWPMDSI